MSRELERLLREARATLPLPRARATMEAREAVVGAMLRRRRGRLRATAVVVVLGLATAAGIGAGLLVTPSGGASSPTVAGLGFLPAKGWMVVQSTPGPAQHSIAVAANVPIKSADVPVDGPPYATVRSLGKDGIVIYAQFTARGNTSTDLGYPYVGAVPSLDDAYRETSWNAQIRPEDPLAQYRLLFANGGYNADVRVYVGRLHPTARQLALAQRQLDRMVIAGEPVTLQASPLIAAWAAGVTLTGSVASGRADELITIEERSCGSSAGIGWTPVAETRTDPGGGWHLPWGAAITHRLRALWRGNVSNVVTIRARPGVTVRQVARARFSVGVLAKKRFEGKTGLLERFDRGRGRFVTVKRFRFADSGSAGVMIWTSARVVATLPKGTLVRAVLPRAAAAPCYLAGYSNMLRT